MTDPQTVPVKILDEEPSVLEQLDLKERKFAEGIVAGMTGIEAAKYCGGSRSVERTALAAVSTAASAASPSTTGAFLFW